MEKVARTFHDAGLPDSFQQAASEIYGALVRNEEAACTQSHWVTSSCPWATDGPAEARREQTGPEQTRHLAVACRPAEHRLIIVLSNPWSAAFAAAVAVAAQNLDGLAGASRHEVASQSEFALTGRSNSGQPIAS
jgi:hypothetical protein